MPVGRCGGGHVLYGLPWCLQAPPGPPGQLDCYWTVVEIRAAGQAADEEGAVGEGHADGAKAGEVQLKILCRL